MVSRLIAGPQGVVEIQDYLQDNALANVVVCHPHPLHGGAMTNKVVTTTIKAARNQGMNAVAFNFRGVGQSEGTFADGQGEQEDLKAVVEWLRQQAPLLPLILAGFSFGSYVAFAQAHALRAKACIALAPAVTRFDFSTIDRGDFPLLVVHGTDDEVVEFDAVKVWFDALSCPKEWQAFDGIGHFFHGQLLVLRQVLEAFLIKQS